MKKILLGLLFIFALTGCAGKAASVAPAPDSESARPAAEAPAATAGAQEPQYNGKEDSSSNSRSEESGAPASQYDANINSSSSSTLNNYSQFLENELLSDEEYLEISESKELSTLDNPLLTFSLKVDTASYGNIVRYIQSGNLPPKDAVKIEEMINYFNYDKILEETDTPFSIYTEIGRSLFDQNKNLAFVRVKSKDIDKEDLPRSNLTFLIDTSGSMNSFDKLPLLKSAFGLLVETLTEDDVVSIVTYAGSSAVVLDSVHGDQKEKIMRAINNLEAGGSTAGADGIKTAYKLAEKNFIKDGNNRVILSTDGDFNVGLSSVNELESLISKKRGNNVYLSVLGFGTENLKDNKMETLAKNGNGNYSYIESVASAKKVLVDELSSNLFTIADDVKTQVEFNPGLVSSYRLIGYENRRLENKDFANDKKDAGEIGVGTDVVLMFELELSKEGNAQDLKYQDSQKPAPKNTKPYSDELFEVRIRYKDPGESESKLMTIPVKSDRMLEKNTDDFNFAAGVAGFGHLLRDSQYKGDITINTIFEYAYDHLGKDKGGYRKEFIELLNEYKRLNK